jgi:hypothetical protein
MLRIQRVIKKRTLNLNMWILDLILRNFIKKNKLLLQKSFVIMEKDEQNKNDQIAKEHSLELKRILDDLSKESSKLTSELDEYIKAVKNLAKLKSDFIFKNSSHTHAAIVLTEMLNQSKREFCLYDNDLSGDIADKYPVGFYPALISFVERGGELKIIVDNHDNGINNTKVYSVLKSLKLIYPQKVQVRKADKKFTDNVENSFKLLLNFAVGDAESFRYEDTNEDELERKAFCSFNNSGIAKRLKNVFDKNFESCPDIFTNN